MAKFIRGIIFWPLLVIAVMLAVANRTPVLLSFDPFNVNTPAFAISVPVFVILLFGVLVGIVVGGMSAWADQAQWRRAARAYQKRLLALEAQNAATVAPHILRNSSSTALTPIHTA